MLTELQKKTVQSIINIFETGKVLGDYSSVVSVVGDPGGLTYGRSQTTLMSGNLYFLIKDYCETESAAFAEQLKPYLNSLLTRDQSLNRNSQLHHLLEQAGRRDPVMWEVQDKFFDRVYWSPAVNLAATTGVKSALGTAVVYDSKVHGSWIRMRNRTVNEFGTVTDIGEQSWIKHYVDVRRDWLANHRTIPLLNKTVYRMDAFIKLIDTGNWNLTLPLKVRSLTINRDTLSPQTHSSAETEDSRLLRLQQPYMVGEDVRQVQDALNKLGLQLAVDGVYGPSTKAAVEQFQSQHNLKQDGIVGPATLAELQL